MAKAKRKNPEWRFDVEAHDYPAARSYLSLLYPEDRIRRIIRKFKDAPVIEFKAKDIFRASRLPLMGVGNSHVREDLDKIRHKQSLSPLLLVRNEKIGAVVIADGYHRLCAVYHLDEDAWIACKII